MDLTGNLWMLKIPDPSPLLVLSPDRIDMNICYTLLHKVKWYLYCGFPCGNSSLLSHQHHYLGSDLSDVLPIRGKELPGFQWDWCLATLTCMHIRPVLLPIWNHTCWVSVYSGLGLRRHGGRRYVWTLGTSCLYVRYTEASWALSAYLLSGPVLSPVVAEVIPRNVRSPRLKTMTWGKVTSWVAVVRILHFFAEPLVRCIKHRFYMKEKCKYLMQRARKGGEPLAHNHRGRAAW